MNGQSSTQVFVRSRRPFCYREQNQRGWAFVGIDVVYISAELAASEPEETTLIDGVPVLVVEILSPSDTQEQVDEKIDDYLRAGVALVWVIDPHDRTVLIYRPNQEPEFVNVRQELSGEPQLPGFRVPAAQLFA